MKSYTQLETELADALAEIRWMKEAMTPPKDFRVPGQRRTKITQYQHVILYALAKTKGYLNETQLTSRLEIISRRDVAPKQVAVVICRLRKRLAEADPRIVIRCDRGWGYYLDDESKALVLGAERKIAA